MAGTSKYKIKYEEEKRFRKDWMERAVAAEDKLMVIEGITYGPKTRNVMGRDDGEERDVVIGVRGMKSSLSSISAKATARGIELARAWHLIRSLSGDHTLQIESAALMKALDEGKIRDFNSVFSPEQTGL